MKKMFNLILMIILLLSITGCTRTSEKLTDAKKFKEEYESLNNQTREKDGKKIRSLSIPEDNPMIYKTAEEVSKMMDAKETFLVYFGFKDCPWCRSVVEELIHVAKDKNIGRIYYVDVKEIRDVKEVTKDGIVETTTEGSKGYYELLEKLDNVLDEYTLYDKDEKEITDGKRIYAPNVVAISEGKPIKLVTGESEGLEDPYQELTDKMRKSTYKKFECLIDCLEKESKTCKKNSC